MLSRNTEIPVLESLHLVPALELAGFGAAEHADPAAAVGLDLGLLRRQSLSAPAGGGGCCDGGRER